MVLSEYLHFQETVQMSFQEDPKKAQRWLGKRHSHSQQSRTNKQESPIQSISHLSVPMTDCAGNSRTLSQRTDKVNQTENGHSEMMSRDAFVFGMF